MSLLEADRHARAYPVRGLKLRLAAGIVKLLAPSEALRRIQLLCDDATEELCALSREVEGSGHGKQVGRAAALIGTIRQIAGGVLQ